MPPFLSRKRSLSESPPPAKRPRPGSATRAKSTLFDAADATNREHRSLEETRKVLDRFAKDDDEDESSLSEVDSDEFEDVKPAKPSGSHAFQAAEDEEEDEIDWEDAIPTSVSHIPQPDEIGDISISMNDDGSYVQPLVSNSSNSNNKKGPSKRERQIRIQTHCLHVTTLLWHNVVRNSWLNDARVHQVLLEGLPHGIKREVTRWREAMGTLTKEELDEKKRRAATKAKGKGGRKGKKVDHGRDWSFAAEHMEQGVPDLSHGDPLLRLLKVLTAYWRKRFVVTAPALRKQGYMTLTRLRDDMKSWEKNHDDSESHGERIENVRAFRDLAEKCEGSRDVGGQLFVALLRAIGLDTRMVVNLQPAGFGWSKAEEADEKRPKKTVKVNSRPLEKDSSDGEEKASKRSAVTSNKKPDKRLKVENPARKSSRGNKGDPISLDDSESPLSDPPSGLDESAMQADDDDDDDLSVVDVTPAASRKPSRKYDRELAFPVYWTEVCSPVSHKYIPVDPIVLSTIASNDDLLQTFEPRGKKADKTKQVICYTVAYSSDGSAKDVTIRYLKRHQLPGKTKGVRMPVEKIPIYDKRGKVKKYENYDWFRTVISMFERPENKRTPADDLEDQTDLKQFKPAEKEKEVEKESLQWYKQSAEFVLEQHLRREEAIVPGANPIKSFIAGKGDKAKEHPVFRREDVVACKTVESWHKEGRAIKIGEQPMKYVPVRAVTLIRKREIEDAQRETGEKLKQGLYSRYQTDWIIPPPIENGVIPKNAFGNMDVYVPTMVPKGAVHLRLKGSAKICRKLQIDYAEACTGFEFGKQRAVPVLTGVVVAKENAAMVQDAWRVEQEEIKRKEDTKRTGIALHWWRKMVLGLRVLQRMQEEYAQSGGNEEEINPFVRKAKRQAQGADGDQSMAGGFLPSEPYDGEEDPPSDRRKPDHGIADDDQGSGGFLIDEEPDHGSGGGFLVEDEPEDAGKAHALITPMSLQSVHQQDDDQLQDQTEDITDEPVDSRTPPYAATRAVKGPSNKKQANSKMTKSRRPPSSEEDEDMESEVLDAAKPGSDDETSSEAKVSNRRRRDLSKPVGIRRVAKTMSKQTRQNGRAKGKSTPAKSQYFVDDEDNEESAVEVIQPRRTTARTRKKA